MSGGLAQSGLGPAEFAATLDIVDAADLTESVDPAPLVSAYIKSVGAGAYGLSANRISESAAASFVRLAMRMSEAVRRSFFAPVDVARQRASRRSATSKNAVRLATPVSGSRCAALMYSISNRSLHIMIMKTAEAMV